jgi:hypothetical protein
MLLKTTEEILGFLENGQVSKDFADAVHECNKTLLDLDGGKATATLKLTLHARQGSGVELIVEITTKLPSRPRRITMAFITPSGHLSLAHPQQVTMFDETRRNAEDVPVMDRGSDRNR